MCIRLILIGLASKKERVNIMDEQDGPTEPEITLIGLAGSGWFQWVPIRFKVPIFVTGARSVQFLVPE